MESVFFKNMPEATVNRTNRKTKKKQTKTLRKLWLRHFPQGFGFLFLFFFVCFLFFCFFCFSFKLCKKLSGRTLGRQKDAKSRSWGGRAYIYIYIFGTEWDIIHVLHDSYKQNQQRSQAR